MATPTLPRISVSFTMPNRLYRRLERQRRLSGRKPAKNKTELTLWSLRTFAGGN